MLVAAAVQAVSSIQAGKAQAAQYESAARAQEYNAAVSRQRAEATQAVTGQREQAQRREAMLVMGKQRAAAAQAGFGLGGSAADVERQSQVMAELDALNIRYEGALEAKGLLDQASLDTFQAGASRSAGSAAKTAGYLGAAGSLLTGTGNYLRTRPPAAPTNSPIKVG